MYFTQKILMLMYFCCTILVNIIFVYICFKVKSSQREKKNTPHPTHVMRLTFKSYYFVQFFIWIIITVSFRYSLSQSFNLRSCNISFSKEITLKPLRRSDYSSLVSASPCARQSTQKSHEQFS